MASHDQETLGRVTGDDETASFLTPSRCCFNFPCFVSHRRETKRRFSLGSSTDTTSPSLWERIRAAEFEHGWWNTPLRAFKKLREWSEIVAGPRWKTFIRRFNRNRTAGRHAAASSSAAAGRFQYDPLSYTLNFDEGSRQYHGDDGDEDCSYYPDFMSRYGSVSHSSKTSVDIGKMTTAAGSVAAG
ncbi:hypothetical protein Dimus_023842 [Dionaea muscipula]